MTRLHLVPMYAQGARRFIGEHHSHNLPPHRFLFSVGVADETGKLVAVGTAMRLTASSPLDRPEHIEITRVATDRTPMACSMVYGHLCSAAKHLGRTRVYTYTLESECATCIKESTHATSQRALPSGVPKGGNSYQLSYRPPKVSSLTQVYELLERHEVRHTVSAARLDELERYFNDNERWLEAELEAR